MKHCSHKKCHVEISAQKQTGITDRGNPFEGEKSLLLCCSGSFKRLVLL